MSVRWVELAVDRLGNEFNPLSANCIVASVSWIPGEWKGMPRITTSPMTEADEERCGPELNIRQGDKAMYGLSTLKSSIRYGPQAVECPVGGCIEQIPRQRKRFRLDPEYLCPKHGIYVSPTAFAYNDETRNLLWMDEHDRELLGRIRTVKRESRLAYNSSEDAASWNVFRHFDRRGLLANLGPVFGFPADGSEELVYWSYSPREGAAASWLVEARREFGEEAPRSSEPDLAIMNKSSLTLIEAKLSASNRTAPTKANEQKKYLTGGDQWFREVFQKSYDEIVFGSKLYELMRFWLLGSWIADALRKKFVLVNLVREGQETDIDRRIQQQLVSTSRRQFIRRTWEDVLHSASSEPEKNFGMELMVWARDKALGYDPGTRRILPAFQIEPISPD